MLHIVPCTLREANAFIRQHHRHHKPDRGHKFSIAVADETGKVRGVVIVGRPKSRMRDDGFTAEATRCCTDGAKNACSMLYAAAWRAARAMGYVRCGTYILESESGVTLRAAGWMLIGQAGGGSWSRESRPRVDGHPTELKLLFEVRA
jgi:hypothetical protein